MKSTVILACPTLQGELRAALKEAGSDAVVYFLPPGLHRDPKALHQYVQNTIDHFYNAERIVVCTTGCGGGNIGIRATTAELIYPKTRDCLDILISKDTLKTIREDRDMRGLFLTASWMEFMKESSIDRLKLEEKMGKAKGDAYLQEIYHMIHDFYIIDTGCYDIEPVREYIQPLVDLLDAELHIIPGGYSVLKKIARGQFDDDFNIIPKGEAVPSDAFPPNF